MRDLLQSLRHAEGPALRTSLEHSCASAIATAVTCRAVKEMPREAAASFQQGMRAALDRMLALKVRTLCAPACSCQPCLRALP